MSHKEYAKDVGNFIKELKMEDVEKVLFGDV